MTVHGNWEGPRGRDWHGIAKATEPLVALVLLATGTEVEWIKSDLGEHGKLEVRLALFPYDTEGFDVQINFSVGQAQRRNRSLIPSSAYKPIVKQGDDFETGRIVRLSTINGKPMIDVGVLFLARSDVTVVRRRIWRIKTNLVELVNPPFKKMSFGRTGIEKFAQWD